jgi:hypothetical protein
MNKTIITVYIDGNEFKSAPQDKPARELADSWYNACNSLNKFQLILSDGGFVCLNEEALSRAVVTFTPVE